MLPAVLTFIDTETTGLSPYRDRIIEIGILRMENGSITEQFETLVNPGCSLPPEITYITGISSQQLEDAPTFDSISPKIQALMRGSVLVAHNAKFDYSFLKSEFSRMDYAFSANCICTAKLSRKLFPRYKRHGLDSIIERFGFACDARHRAFADAKVLADFYLHILNQYGEEKLGDAIAYVTKTGALPPNISRDAIAALPESPGVYLFYDDQGAPLYIGKSINVKDRVLSHFYDYSRSGKEAKIFQTIKSIEAKPTSGELGALLLESQLIKQMQPLYNRQLRRQNTMIALLATTTPQGYRTIERRDVSEIGTGDIGNIIGVYRTEKQMKHTLVELSREHRLCQKILGLEKTRDRCFGSQIETCNGACTGDELPARYNMRFTEAFHASKIKSWPFTGPISITEGNQAHVVYQWCYLGTAEEIHGWNDGDSPNGLAFDFDTYKILSSYLLRKTRDHQIHVLPQPKFGLNGFMTV
jgi:DNA polymerase III subunit epsilon